MSTNESVCEIPDRCCSVPLDVDADASRDAPEGFEQLEAHVLDVGHAAARDELDPSRAFATLTSLLTFWQRCLASPSEENMSRAISASCEFIALAPDDHPLRDSLLSRVLPLLIDRMEHFPITLDADKALSMHHDLLRLVPSDHADKARYLHRFGSALRARFERTGELSDVHAAISLLEDAVRHSPDTNVDKPAMLNELSYSFARRFERVGNIDDIHRAIATLQDAVRLTPDGQAAKPIHLMNLGNSFARRFMLLEDVDDIDRSISAHQAALSQIPDGDPSQCVYLSNLGGSFMTRFRHSEKVDDLHQAISALEHAVRLCSLGDASNPRPLTNLGISLLARFELLGDVSDLDRAISLQGDAVHLISDDHSDKPETLNNLGNSYAKRFERLGEVGDLHKMVSALGLAEQLTAAGHPEKPRRLEMLGTAYRMRFDHLGDYDDIHKAVSLHQSAVQLCPDGHPERPSLLSNLGNSHLTRFVHLGEVDDVVQAIAMQETAVRLTSNGGAEKHIYLRSLANSLARRFQRLRDVSDIQQAILVQEDALHLLPDDHPDKLSCSNNLAKLFVTRYRHDDDATYLKPASEHFSSAAHAAGHPSARFEASSGWALCSRMLEPSSQLDAYAVALNLLPQVAWLGLKMEGRHRELTKVADVVRDAVATAIEFQKYELAVEWLEQGRSVVWGQLLQLRSPVDALSSAHPQLAERLGALSSELQRSNTGTDSLLSVLDIDGEQSSEEAAQRHRRLVQDWEKLLKEIRSFPGFEAFLLSKAYSQITVGVRCSPVIVLNASRYRCDALVIQSNADGVHHIPLTDCTFDDALKLRELLDRLLFLNGRISTLERASSRPLTSSTDKDAQFEALLAALWRRVVKPVVDALGLAVPSSANDLPRLWWCPTGPFAFLPIHAAGMYRDKQSGSKLSDFAVSSYTPTIGALAISSTSLPPPDFNLLAVAQSNAKGQPPIPCTLEEVDRIQRCAGTHHMQTLKESEATVARVMLGMEHANWVHLACHGVQHRTNPLKSALILAEGARLELSQIIQKSLPQAELAFLSACQTAKGDDQLSEEAVHLAAGMLLSGYRGVIATMWSISDKAAPQVAADVYTSLFGSSGARPDSTQAAHALHNAVQRLRERLGDKGYSTWVPYIHIGM